MKILIVEDEEKIRNVEKLFLEQAGYNVIALESGKEALEIIEKNHIDLVLLDLNLPEVDGVEVCKRIKANHNLPVIMITARISDIDEWEGLESGADDYIKKPFNPVVLVARVKSLFRRFEIDKVEIGEISLDPKRRQVFKKGENIKLTTTQFNILYVLMSHPNQVFTRDEIMNKAYNDPAGADIFDRTVDSHIKNIRKLIEKDFNKPEYIRTVIGVGYKFNKNGI